MVQIRLPLDFKFLYRGVEQRLARWAHNPKAVGSSPTPAIFFQCIQLNKIHNEVTMNNSYSVEWSVLAQAPSNIALIKYMAKADAVNNIPENPSISLTSNKLKSIVKASFKESFQDHFLWSSSIADLQQLSSDEAKIIQPSLSEAEKTKVWIHFQRVKTACAAILPKFDLKMKEGPLSIQVSSANTFPQSTGIASSASSFAALTLAFVGGLAGETIKDFTCFQATLQNSAEFRVELAKLSQQASGSSCRSFQGPWVYWQQTQMLSLDTSHFPSVVHFVILVDQKAKKISSSEAHFLVKSSVLWQGRSERACQRADRLLAAFTAGEWNTIATIAWEEMWDMHELFHTYSMPFSYLGCETHKILEWIQPEIVSLEPSILAPIVTLDAGPNVHFIVPEKDSSYWSKRLKKQMPYLTILEDSQGCGPSIQSVNSHSAIAAL